MNIFKPSIISFSSVLDCKMILTELKTELSEVVTDDIQLQLILNHLQQKEIEVDERYNNR